MKQFNLLFIVFGLVSLSACGDPAQPSGAVETTERIPVTITESDLFRGNLILAFLDNEEKFIQEANELFLRGVDSYRNKRELDSANYYFRKSILKEPSAKAYFELGNVSMEMEEYETAILAFGVAEQLNYEPFSKILYNKSCIYSLQEKNELSGKYLEYALQAGYNNLNHIEDDTDLENLRDTYYYNQAVEKGLRGTSDAKNLFWLQFKKQFSVVDLPMTLPTELNEEKMVDMVSISYDYEKYIAEMRDEEFSREVSKEFYYYARPYESENYVAVIYAVRDIFMGEYAPITYRMATFTHEGTLIDKRQIGGREMLSEPVLVPTLNKDGLISVVRMEPKYENDPDDYGYYENPMVSSEQIGVFTLRITEKGEIIEEEAKDLSLN